MNNADLIKKARAAADALTIGAQRSDAYEAEMLIADVDLFNGLADALEQCERAKVELALENGKLRARLNRWERKK